MDECCYKKPHLGGGVAAMSCNQFINAYEDVCAHDHENAHNRDRGDGDLH